MKIVVTGASGFIGQHLVEYLSKSHQITAFSRHVIPSKHVATVVVNFQEKFDPEICLENMQDAAAVVHLAGVAHDTTNNNNVSPDIYHQINVELSTKIFESAVQAGIKKFIYVSSVKAAAERSHLDSQGNPVPIKINHGEVPEDVYGKSKLAAEKNLKKISRNVSTQLVILRLPLVYGAGQKGNLQTLFRICSAGIPLPLGLIRNQRSMLSVNNCCDAIRHVIENEGGRPGVYFLSDCVISTPELARAFAEATGKSIRLFPCPVWLLNIAAAIIGKRAMMRKLSESLLVDPHDFESEFNWHPPFSFTEVLKQIAARCNYRATH